MNNTWKKIGWFCFAFVPMIGYLAITLIVSAVGSAVLAFVGMSAGITDIASLLMENLLPLQVCGQIAGLLVFSIWYYFGCGRPSLKIPKGILSIRNVAAVILAGIGIQLLTSVALQMVSVIFPRALDSYGDLMETAGLNETTLLSVLSAVVLAPLVEELIFRGITIHIASRLTQRFWIANIIQALAFGIVHLNIVQSSYAFIMGLFIGWFYLRFRSLYVCIFLHLVINLSGMILVEPLANLFPHPLITLLVFLAVGIAGVFGGLSLIKQRQPTLNA